MKSILRLEAKIGSAVEILRQCPHTLRPSEWLCRICLGLVVVESISAGLRVSAYLATKRDDCFPYDDHRDDCHRIINQAIETELGAARALVRELCRSESSLPENSRG